MVRKTWWLTCTIIFLSPITLIVSHPSAILVFDCLCLIACLLAITSKRTVAGECFVLSLTAPFLLISIYLIVQAIPLSPETLKTLTAETWQNYQETVWRLSPGAWMPISSHVESTLYAWLHICSLWALCLTFVLLIDSHWRLLQLVKTFSVGAALWSILIIATSVEKGLFWWVPQVNENIIYQFRVALGHWVVIFLPILFAGHSAFRSNGTNHAFAGRFRNSVRKPELSPRVVVILSLCLSCFGLLLTVKPVLWLTVLTGYLLFQSLKLNHSEDQPFIHKRVIHFIAFVCVISLFAWNSFTSSIPQTLESISRINISDRYFSWFGYGLGVNHTNSPAVWSNQSIEQGGGLVEIWSGLGLIGTFLLLVAMLALYHGVGSREVLNKSEQMTTILHSAGIVGLVLLLTTGNFGPFGQWLSMITAIIFLTIFMTCCQRVSNLMVAGETHVISKQAVWALRGIVCTLLTAMALLAALKATSGLLVEKTVSQAFDRSDASQDKDGVELWQKTLSAMMLFNSNFFLDQGQRYLIQKRDREAKSSILKAFKLHPLSPQAHIAVASLSACIGDESTAMDFFSTKIAKNYVPDSSTELLVARLLGVAGSESGIKLINLVLEHSPQLAGLYLNLMMLYGYEPLTLQSFFPEHPFIMLAIGDLLLTKGYNKEAESAYRSAVYNKSDDFSQNEMLYVHIARYFASAGRLSEAILIAKKGIKANPQSLVLKTLTDGLNAQAGL